VGGKILGLLWGFLRFLWRWRYWWVLQWSFTPLVAKDVQVVLHLCGPRSLPIDILPVSFGALHWSLPSQNGFLFLLELSIPCWTLAWSSASIAAAASFSSSSSQSRCDQPLRLLEACVLAKVLVGMTDTEPLQSWLEVAVLWLGSAVVVEVHFRDVSLNAGCSHLRRWWVGSELMID
jgi:hypothetical protein